jgi:hypothetical protein
LTLWWLGQANVRRSNSRRRLWQTATLETEFAVDRQIDDGQADKQRVKELDSRLARLKAEN